MVDPLVMDHKEARTLGNYITSRESKNEITDLIFSHRSCRGAMLRIDLLDLSKPKQATLRSIEDDGEGWSAKEADEAEKWYKLFLKLHLICPKADIVPPKHADRLWHAHILFTQKYHRDCTDIFGDYFHHNPFGSEATIAETEERVHRTIELFIQHFGEAPEEFHFFCNNCGIQ